MKLRCPAANHPINIPDDFAGSKIICPQCKIPIFLDRKQDTGEQIQAGSPPVSGNDLAEQIYDGLPPLSVMLALRRSKGGTYDADDFPSKYEMTPDDWKALDAYECVLHAAYGLRTTLAVAGFALAANLPFLALFSGDRDLLPHDRDMFERVAIGAVIFLIGCLTLFFFASRSLQRIRIQGLVEWLSVAACCALVIYLCGTVFGVCQLNSGRQADAIGTAALLSFPFNCIAVIDLLRTLFRVNKALKQIEPPEITNRLVEALKYLD